MAERNDEAPEEAEEVNPVADTAPKVEEADKLSKEDSEAVDSHENQQQEEEMMKKKYGGLLKKKPPLISKDNERAFFDSADWALGKKTKGPLEALRPKLQPTPHQHLRSRSVYSREDGFEDGCNPDDLNPEENQESTKDGGTIESNNHSVENHPEK